MSDIFRTGGNIIALYPTPQSMEDKVNEYFKLCFVSTVDPKTGEVKIKERKTPTYSGMARYLGFSSRMAMIKYAADRDEAYNAVVSDARLRLEDYWESKLAYTKAPAGIMFNLKNNAGWDDKSTQQLTTGDGQPLVFGWAADAGDVIDTRASEVKPKKELPAAAKEGVVEDGDE